MAISFRRNTISRERNKKQKRRGPVTGSEETNANRAHTNARKADINDALSLEAARRDGIAN